MSTYPWRETAERAAARHAREAEETPGQERERIMIETMTRQSLAREHNAEGHPDGQRRAGCPYCHAPGPSGDYTPQAAPAPSESTTRDIADIYVEASAP